MSFGWSAGDLLAAFEFLNKVRVALKEAGGAASDYQAEIAFLTSLNATLKHLDALQSVPINPGLVATIKEHCEQVQKPLDAFLRAARDKYARLEKRTSAADVLSAPRKVQWALSTSKQVKELRGRIAGNLDAIQITLMQATL